MAFTKTNTPKFSLNGEENNNKRSKNDVTKSFVHLLFSTIFALFFKSNNAAKKEKARDLSV